MCRFKRPARRLGLALVVAVIVPGCLEPLLSGVKCSASAAPSLQGSRPVSSSTSQSGYTRPRRVDHERGDLAASEPRIRVGLMTDVSVVALSSPSGIVVRRSAAYSSDTQEIASGQVRVELRQQLIPVVAQRAVYRVEAATASEPRQVRKIIDDLKKRIREPLTSPYDSEAKNYRILTGQYSTRTHATDMVARLRREGYFAARIVSEPVEREAGGVVIGKDQPATRKSQTPQRAAQLVALEADKMVASSTDLLIVTAADAASDAEKASDTEKATARKEPKYKDAPSERDSRQPPAPRPPAVRVGDKWYRGDIHIVVNERGRLNVINELPLEAYLRGVVPKELSPVAYPEIEALKAQAVAARTYALSRRGRYGSEGFDLRDDARSQVYGGISAEHPLTNRAVEETRGKVAVYPDEEGRPVPIEAVYTANCGGHTEDNDAIFLTRPVPYLRSVECAPDRAILAEKEISSGWSGEPLIGPAGRMIARDVAVLDVLGFALPRRVTNQYLRGSVEQAELIAWAERAAEVAGHDRPRQPRTDITRLPGFVSLISSAVYGDGRASLLLSPVDAEYMLSGIAGEDLPPDTRADMAMLLRDGVLRQPPDGRISAQVAVTRGYAIETLARALYLKSRVSNLKTGTALPAEKNCLVISRPAASKAEGRRKENSARPASTRIEVERGAWLFRRLGSESYGVERLTLIGGERVTFHLNASGRIDFLEAEISERGASSDRFSSVAMWRDTLSAEELQRRLARARVEVGKIEGLEPIRYGRSNRVLEMEVVGSRGRSRLRGHQIRNALGLKENLFVVDRKLDEQGGTPGFIFTGRGWGHGVGMCQTGAYGLARDGYSYSKILQKYYTGVKLQKIY